MCIMFTIFQALVILFLLILLLTAWWYLSIPSNLPPGPRGWPIFGSMFDTSNPDKLITKLCEWKEQYGPVYKFYSADTMVLVLGDLPALQEAFLKQADNYSRLPSAFYVYLQDLEKRLGHKLSEDAWKEQRRFLLSSQRDLGVGKSALESQIKGEVEKFLDEIGKHKGRPFNPTEILRQGVANVISEFLFGKRFDYNHPELVNFLKMTHFLYEGNKISMVSPFIISDRVSPLMAKFPQTKQFQKRCQTVFDFLQNKIAQSKLEFDKTDYSDKKPTTYVQSFYKAQQDGGPKAAFSDPQLLVNVFDLYHAGMEPISTSLRWVLLYLCKNPEWQEEIYNEIRTQMGSSSSLPDYADRGKLPLTEATFLEIQRLADMTFGCPRQTCKPAKLFGYDIPENTIVVALISSLMRDPKIYPNPDKFDPRRFLEKENNNEEYKKRLSNHLPYHIGKRSCPCESLAKIELFLFFTGLVTRYQFSFSPEEPTPPSKGICGLLGNYPAPYKICAKARND